MRPALVWLGAVAALALSWSAADSRPLTVEDVLAVEGLGRTAVSPGGRWLVLERRRAYQAAARFDYGQYTDLFRTELQVTDLRTEGALRALFPQEPGTGYALGPFSPDGTRLIVLRLKDERWEMGIAEPASGSVTWTGLTPELPEQGRAFAWRSPSEVVLIALPAGLQPMQLRLHAPTRTLPVRWAATAAGDVSMTLVGSGRFRRVRPRDPPSRLLVLNTVSGARRLLAEGEFTDLELSASGRWAAVLEAGEDVRLRPEAPIQGAHGLAKRRLRLRLFDLNSGFSRSPCAGCDFIGSLLSWSPAADELLAFARQDGQPWTTGRLLRITGSGAVTGVAERELTPVVGGRPETVRAGWMGASPLIYARPKALPAGRPDWWRVSKGATDALTAVFPEAPAEGVATDGERLLARVDGQAFVLDAAGRIIAAVPAGFRPPAPSLVPGFPRFGRVFLERPALAGVIPGDDADWLVEVTIEGRVRRLQAPAGAELVQAAGSGALLRAPAGGSDHLLWVGRDGARLLDVLNSRLSDVDLPLARPVRHAGPDGRALTSWLILPPTFAATSASPAAAPPLVIWPYPGRSYDAAPTTLHPRFGLYEDPPRLLASHGYAVLLPSLPRPRGDATPADGLGEVLLGIVQAAAADPDLAGAFDPNRLAIWGHSFGGYAALAAITQTDRFGAAIAAASMPSLFTKWGDLAPRRLWPEQGLADPGWTEDLQGDTRGPPWRTPERFLRGSPLLRMDRATTPLLLVHGEMDNFALLGAEQAFTAYLRQDKDAQLATYWGEPHVIRSPGNLRDYYARAIAFLDARLGFTPPAARLGSRSSHPSAAPIPRSRRRAATAARRRGG